MNLSPELIQQVKDHLDEVRKYLGNLPADERQEILQSIESHIYDALENRSDGEPAPALLEAVLAEMDPPESYGEPDSVPQKQRSRRWLVVTLCGLALVALAATGIKGWRNTNPNIIEHWNPGEKIIEGVGIADFRIGASKEQLIAALGTPDEESTETWLRWKNLRVHSLVDEYRGASELRFDIGFPGTTEKGIKIGSSEAEVLAAYGSPEHVVSKNKAKKLTWSSQGILVGLTIGNGVNQIVVFRPHFPSYKQSSADLNPNLIGRWMSIDFVETPDQFDPETIAWGGDLFLKELTLLPDGKTDRPFWTWTNEYLIHSENYSVSKLFIKTISGEDYLFLEWMSGDVTLRGQPPKYYVLKKEKQNGDGVFLENKAKPFLQPVEMPSTPQPPSGKYAFQIIKIEAPAEIVQSPQTDVENIIQHPDVKICESPTLIAGLGESVTNEQIEAMSMDVDWGLVDGKAVTKEKTFKLGDSISVTVNKAGNETIGYHLNVHHLELAGFFEHKITNGFLEKTQPRFKKEAVDTDLTQKLNSWLMLQGIIEPQPDGKKINRITCIRVISPDAIQKECQLNPVAFEQGCNTLEEGDSIVLDEVLSTSPLFAEGDVVTVKGRYTLSSQPSARLALFVTGTRDRGRSTVTKEQRVTVTQGTGEFALTQTIPYHGCSHLTFYDETTGAPLGGIYFGTKKQIEEIKPRNSLKGYAWQQTEPYTAPNFYAFFPNDPEGGRALDALWRAADKDSRPDEEILETVRNGLRCTREHKTLILAWIGGRYICGKSPQNPEAVEIMYHAADFSGENADPQGTRHYAVYYGLSVVQPKTPAVLRTLVDLCMRVDDPNDLHAVAWNSRSQSQGLLGYLDPYLKSKDKAVQNKAIVLEQIFTGKLKAFDWARQQTEKLRTENTQSANSGQSEISANAEKQKSQAKARMREDSDIYSQEELREIESLYQVANKKWRSEEGKDSLKKLVSKYSAANRTGCALLYLGQMSTGDEQINYLKQAIENFSDCFYGDGVQVGAYARFVLWYRYRNDGEKEKAAGIAEEIRINYPDAIDHRGRNVVELLKTVED